MNLTHLQLNGSVWLTSLPSTKRTFVSHCCWVSAIEQQKSSDPSNKKVADWEVLLLLFCLFVPLPRLWYWMGHLKCRTVTSPLGVPNWKRWEQETQLSLRGDSPGFLDLGSYPSSTYIQHQLMLPFTLHPPNLCNLQTSEVLTERYYKPSASVVSDQSLDGGV